MKTITILGAGAMGSALTTPLVNSGWTVRLWGSRYDEDLLAALEMGQPHPSTGVSVLSSVALFRDAHLAEALDGAQVVVLAVSAAGVFDVLRRALPHLAAAQALLLTSKGLYEDKDGQVRFLPQAMRQQAEQDGYPLPPVVTIAGPCLAEECGADSPTAAVFACQDLEVAAELARSMRTDTYAIQPSDDEIGVGVCAPLKNVYAIGLGIIDGLEESGEVALKNLRAAAFAQAVKEMSILGWAMGGRPETAYGLAGLGDLEVTSRSGRNALYGVRIGGGETPERALEEMGALSQTVEGLSAARMAAKLVEQRGPDSDVLRDSLPLLGAVVAILEGDTSTMGQLLADAILPPAP